jgi:SAM-dependent methyltransferase
MNSITSEQIHRDDPTAAACARGAQRIQVQLKMFADAGFNVPHDARILDLGCGNGNIVAEYRRAGYQAFGCDFAFKPGPHVDELARKNYIRLIDRGGDYRLPFDNREFDFVVSDQVFEHVQNYAETLAEHRRVMKTSGAGLHFIPSRYAPVEGHVFVPFATMLQDYWWLRLWSQLGIRTKAQRGMSAEECARRNEQYLKTSTNYLTKQQMSREFGRHFAEVRYVEDLFLKYSRRARRLHDLSTLIPAIPDIYSALRSRVVLCSAPIAKARPDLSRDSSSDSIKDIVNNSARESA